MNNRFKQKHVKVQNLTLIVSPQSFPLASLEQREFCPCMQESFQPDMQELHGTPFDSELTVLITCRRWRRA